MGDFELDDINIEGRVRAPLVAHLRDRESGAELLFMVNHLYRSNAAGRHEQAELLNAWGREQDLPVVAVGDYNFDWSVTNGDADHDAGFDGMTADGVFAWVRPAELVRTQCSAHDSVLDFVFVAGPAGEWPAESTILKPEPSYCPGDDTTSDHRPVMAAFELPPAGEAAPPSVEELMARIERVEETVRDVRARLDRLGQ